MRVPRPFVLTLILASLAVAAAVFAFGRGGPRAAAPREGAAPGAESGLGEASAESEEVRRLRAELKTKDGLIRALTTHAIASDAERRSRYNVYEIESLNETHGPSDSRV